MQEEAEQMNFKGELASTNLERKYLLSSAPDISVWLDKNSALVGTFEQVDDYFYSSGSLVKHRKINGASDSIIVYSRGSKNSELESNFFKVSTSTLFEIEPLISNLLVRRSVRKTRSIYRGDGFLVNEDSVSKVGQVIEVEVFGADSSNHELIVSIENSIGLDQVDQISLSNFHLICCSSNFRELAKRGARVSFHEELSKIFTQQLVMNGVLRVVHQSLSTKATKEYLDTLDHDGLLFHHSIKDGVIVGAIDFSKSVDFKNARVVIPFNSKSGMRRIQETWFGSTG